MTYRIQVLMAIPFLSEHPRSGVEWRDVHPTNEPPYEYETYGEANSVARKSYPDHRNRVRVVSI